MTSQFKINPRKLFDQSQVAINNGNWICICQNTPDSDGFTPITADGILTDMGLESELYRCNSCGRVIQNDNGAVVGTTTKLVKGHPTTQKGLSFLRELGRLMARHYLLRLTGTDDGRVWLVFLHDTDSTHNEPEPFDLSLEDLRQL